MNYNPNQKIAGPYGDVFLVNTAYTDRAAQQLYAEQKQREAKQQQMNAVLDDEFSKNLAGIRDADIPELTSKYTDWKLANMGAMKQKSGITPEQQMELLRKKADMYGVINQSKQERQWEEENGKGLMTNPDRYSDNAHDYLIQRRRTPLSMLDKNKDNSIYYSGTNTDFSKILTSAAGQPKQVYVDEKPVDKEGIQTQITPYQFGNTPQQFYESIVGSLSQRKAGRDAAAIIANTPPETIMQVQEKYNQIPPEKWQKMGVDKPQDLTIKPDDTPAIIYAKHEAQMYALNNEPKQGMPVFKTNEALKIKKDQDFKLKMDAINFEQQKKLKAIELSNAKELDKEREKNKAKGAEAEDLWLDNYLDKVDESADKDKTFLSVPAIGLNLKTKGSGEVKANNYLYTQLGKPDIIKVLPDKKYQITYYQYDDKGNAKVEGGKPVVDNTRSGTFTRDDVKLMMGSKAVGKKQLGKEMNAQPTKKDPLGLGL